MQALLGFELDFWDYLTFLTLALVVVSVVVAYVWLAGLPGRIAIARKHPEAATTGRRTTRWPGHAGREERELHHDPGLRGRGVGDRCVGAAARPACRRRSGL